MWWNDKFDIYEYEYDADYAAAAAAAAADDDDINVAHNRNPRVVLTATLRRCVRLPAHKYHRGRISQNYRKLKFNL